MSRWLIVALGVGLSGCASTGSTGSGGDPSVLTAEQIAVSSARNAYDLIQNLRPRWLQTRGQYSMQTTTQQTATGTVSGMTAAEIVVYLDGARVGGADSLRQIDPRNLASMQRLSATDATQRFGTGHIHGAIVLVSRSN